jgi:serine/threonine protein kinase
MITPALGVVVGGRYVLVRPLAKGGMGSVWVARHRELDVDVSIKFMMPTLIESAELRARFEREAKVAARLRSQHVVQVLDFGIDDGMPYIAMELLQGENLGDRMKRESRIALPVAAQIIVQVCKALRTAHDAGLVHRDLKPGNVFLAMKDGEHVVKVLDFGIVKETSKNDADEVAGATETGVMMGSVHYMSPEQIRSSRQVDHRSDLWSVAVILYKMLTGNAPFPGTNTGDVMVRVCTDSCPPPSFVVPEIPAAVDAFFVKALTREPAGRFQSAQEMADAFTAAVSGSVPISISATPQPPKWVKTLPLAGNSAALQAAIEMASGTPGQSQRPPQPSASSEAPYMSSALDAAPGTFQAVTMPPGQLIALPGSAIAVPKSSSNLSKGVVLGAGLAVVVIGLGVGIFLMQQGSGTDESAQAAPTPSSSFVAPNPNVAVTMHPAVEPMGATPSAVAPLPATPSTTTGPLPTAKTTAPTATAPTATAPAVTTPVPTTPTATTPVAPAPSPRPNPLDIND